MNPKTINDSRSLVWTVSESVPDTYCLYIDGILMHENLSFEEFYPLYKGYVANKR